MQHTMHICMLYLLVFSLFYSCMSVIFIWNLVSEMNKKNTYVSLLKSNIDYTKEKMVQVI